MLSPNDVEVLALLMISGVLLNTTLHEDDMWYGIRILILSALFLFAALFNAGVFA